MAALAVLEVITPGPLTTAQDLGRRGFGRYGVAPGGAADPFALRVANLLVDNLETEAALEITLGGFKAKILADAVAAVTGADFGLVCNRQPVKSWRSFSVRAGDVLACTALNGGCRAYLAVGGGFSLPSVLASKSTSLSSRFGGLDGRPLQSGDVLRSNSPGRHLRAGGRTFDCNLAPVYRNCHELRVIPGPQEMDFTEAGLDTFLNTWYRVTPHSDRTGIRLQGEAVEVKAGLSDSIISEGLVPGAVQVPGDGQPIILLRETVTGGYRKIATVISADLHLLGQLLPEDQLRFRAVSIREARQALWRLEERIARLRDGLV